MLKLVSLVLAIFFISCSTINSKQSVSEDFKKYWNPTMDRSILDDPLDETRITANNESLNFNGNIIAGDCDRIESKLKVNKINELIVNSQGGLVSEGLCISSLFKKYNIRKVIVSGVCWSSCANYLFLAGNERIIRKGTVGFHGNATAIMNKFNLIPALKNFKKNKNISQQDLDTIRRYLESKNKSSDLNNDEINLLKKAITTYEAELAFFTEIGVSQNFFDRTQRSDKGEGDSNQYLFLLPKKTFFSRELGIEIVGDQDQEFVFNANNKFPVKLLLKD